MVDLCVEPVKLRIGEIQVINKISHPRGYSRFSACSKSQALFPFHTTSLIRKVLFPVNKPSTPKLCCTGITLSFKPRKHSNTPQLHCCGGGLAEGDFRSIHIHKCFRCSITGRSPTPWVWHSVYVVLISGLCGTLGISLLPGICGSDRGGFTLYFVVVSLGKFRRALTGTTGPAQKRKRSVLPRYPWMVIS